MICAVLVKIQKSVYTHTHTHHHFPLIWFIYKLLERQYSTDHVVEWNQAKQAKWNYGEKVASLTMQRIRKETRDNDGSQLAAGIQGNSRELKGREWRNVAGRTNNPWCRTMARSLFFPDLPENWTFFVCVYASQNSSSRRWSFPGPAPAFFLFAAVPALTYPRAGHTASHSVHSPASSASLKSAKDVALLLT